MAGTDVRTADGARVDEDVPSGPSWLLRDSWTEALRHIRALPRNPEVLAFATIQPVMFVLLFVYVFGGSISVAGYEDYKQFLLPGIFAQTVLWGTTFTAVGLAEDLSKGIVDRLRSLPMHPAAVLVGRTISDLVRNLVTFVVMLVVAFAVGFRFQGSATGAAAATLLLFLFSFAFSWVQAVIGMSVGSAEAANSAGFTWMFPLTFVSSAFVDPATMPSWMERAAEVNPFTILTDASRALYNGKDAGNDPAVAVAWAVGITLVSAALAVRRFTAARRR
jgi:ABC-2 type transport system permease protein